MKKQFQSKSVPRGTRTIWRYLGALFLLFTFAIGNVWGADTELANFNFKSWDAGSISAGSTVNGIYFKSAVTVSNDKGITVSGNASTSSNYLAIPLSNVNGSITIEVTHQSKRPQWKHAVVGYDALPASISNPSSVADNVRPSSNTTTSSWSVNVAKSYAILYIGKGSNGVSDIYSIRITTPAPETKHHVTYVLNNGTTETAPTQADVAEGASFTVASAAGITPPTNKKFFKWSDGTNYYAAGDSYTMGTSDVTLTAQWVDDLPDPTATFADATYIIGQGTLDMSAKFSSNSAGAVTYALKEASANASITAAGVFSATAAGEYVVVANQAQVPSTYAAISKEATVTVLDNELTDTYVWKKAKYTGSCVASPNADAPAAQYTSVTVDGMASVATGRPGTAETNVTITIAATQTGFGITSLCVYGKSEEAAGFKYSWDGGSHWTDVAPVKDGDDNYIDAKFTFNAPAGTFPDNIIIKFTEAEAGKGGLWLRNALVTLQVKKTIASTVVELNNVMVNGTPISDANLNSLKTNKSLAISTEYAAAPTVTFVKRTTVNYEGGWAADVTDEEIEVTASDASTVWSASQQIGTNTYAVTLAKPAEPSLVTSATGVTLTSAKIATDEQSFTFSGLNLDHSVAISLESEVAGMSVSPAVVIPTDGAITDQEVTITYKSLENVAEANVNLIVSYSETVKLTIPLTYSSTQGFEELTSISAATTWDWNHANSSTDAIESLDANNIVVFANYSGWDESFKANSLAGRLQYVYRENNYAQGHSLKFNTTVPGKVYIKYSNTGNRKDTDPARAPRVTDANGTYAPTSGSRSAGWSEDDVYSHNVVAGDVLIEGFEIKDPIVLNMLRYYEVKFLPTHTLSFAEAGEVEPMTVAETEKAVLPEPATVPSGMSFIGWYLGEDKVGDTGDEYTMGTADVELTAKFSAPAETPVINAQPESSAYCAGSEPTLTVGVNAVSDGGTLHYAWFKVGEPDAAVGTDAASYTIETAGTYYVIITNQKTGSADASVTSENAVVTLNAGAEITAQPAALQVVDAGDAVELSVTATNATAYQWYKGGVLIEGAQAATYNFTAAVGVATYYCVVTGACGDVQSNNAVVYVESGDCNTAGYGDGADNVFGTRNANVELGTYVTYKYSKSPNDFNILVGSTSTGVKAHKMDGEFYVWTANTELAAITTSVLTNDTEGGKYCVVFYDVAGYQPDDSHIISVVELTAGLKNAAQTFDVTPAPAGAKCARLVRKVVWNETTYGEDSQTYIYAFRACALVPAEKPVISGDLSDLAVCALGNDALEVTVATPTDGGTLSYQWYNADGDVAIENEVSASYTPTAVGSYYVIVTNTLAGSPSSSTKSATAAVSVKAATAITVYANATGTIGAPKTLSVTAENAQSYIWQACDENGLVTDETILGTEASYAVTITAEPQYYLVTVHGECGDLTQVLSAKEWHEVELQDVTGSMTWNLHKTQNPDAWGEITSDITVSATTVLANIDNGIIPNNNSFRSDMLKLVVGEVQTKIRKGTDNGVIQGNEIMFHTTVPGIVIVNYRGTGNSANVNLAINGDTLGTYKGGMKTSRKVFVPAGDVVISSGADAFRIQKIQFIAEADYTRPVTEGRYGTICLPNNGVMTGAAIFEIAYMDYMNNKPYKIYFDEVLNGKMEAGMPYIFLPNEAATQLGVFYTDAVNAPAGDNNGLYGSYTKELLAQNAGNYILYNNQYYYVNSDDVFVGENRAYIYLAEVPNFDPGQPAYGRRRVSMNVNAEQVVTDIDNLNAGEQPVKMMIDGKLYILRGEKMFDATGRLVK